MECLNTRFPLTTLYTYSDIEIQREAKVDLYNNIIKDNVHHIQNLKRKRLEKTCTKWKLKILWPKILWTRRSKSIRRLYIMHCFFKYYEWIKFVMYFFLIKKNCFQNVIKKLLLAKHYVQTPCSVFFDFNLNWITNWLRNKNGIFSNPVKIANVN